MSEIQVKVRPGMNMPLEDGGRIRGGDKGKITTISEDYYPKVSYFCEKVESDEPPADDEKPKAGTTKTKK